MHASNKFNVQWFIQRFHKRFILKFSSLCVTFQVGNFNQLFSYENPSSHSDTLKVASQRYYELQIPSKKEVKKVSIVKKSFTKINTENVKALKAAQFKFICYIDWTERIKKLITH